MSLGLHQSECCDKAKRLQNNVIHPSFSGEFNQLIPLFLFPSTDCCVLSGSNESLLWPCATSLPAQPLDGSQFSAAFSSASSTPSLSGMGLRSVSATGATSRQANSNGFPAPPDINSSSICPIKHRHQQHLSVPNSANVGLLPVPSSTGEPNLSDAADNPCSSVCVDAHWNAGGKGDDSVGEGCRATDRLSLMNQHQRQNQPQHKSPAQLQQHQSS
ncbi:unnamed protein product, partial [Protopolystoma xenopodis]